MKNKQQGISRRNVLKAAALLMTAWGVSARGEDGRPAVTNPRATSGDDRYEPKWDEKLTVTVGPELGDMNGTTDKVIQAAVNYVSQLGGGTIQILPGTYRLRNAIHLASNIRLIGSGENSVLIKEPYFGVKLAEDSDWYDQEVTVTDGGGFKVGDGIALMGKSTYSSVPIVIKRTIVAKSGNRFKLNKALRENVWLAGEPMANSLFPLLTGEEVENIAIENITLDGNRDNNPNFNGNYGGNIFFQDCRRIDIRGITTRNYNGDGISWQICHDVTVENCHSLNNADLGLHPGSGSQRPLIRDNRLEKNGLGLFWCWGVKYGLAERNIITDSKTYGVSIGHCDTDNIIRDNQILRSGQIGVLFRDEQKSFAAHRNQV
ncbi:MAG: right-handed parallel beta-helix repeat-containing protein, partial [Planctomycetaceae bacterium]|nr:right-handed parallel beta-helix repeat-containing protein [Planctomycetaceae bacterium]